MIPTRLVLLISVLYIAALPLHAEMIFQKKKSKFEKEWRQAGSDLFDGIARIFDGLAALEQKKMPRARDQFSSAITSLDKAADGYSRVAHEATAEEKMSLDSLPPEEATGIRQLFSRYDHTPPEDERAAAEIAAKESKRLQVSLDELTEQITKSDVKALQELMAGIRRVEVLGTQTALLMDLPAQNKR